ncbi:hypothetical protein [Streptomyces sp. NPDC048442]|uniref:hypothetical protein n=1 Tax=Streptomyces sp. NPDC048442 TaxID=3154823 RepID=UPI00342E2205
MAVPSVRGAVLGSVVGSVAVAAVGRGERDDASVRPGHQWCSDASRSGNEQCGSASRPEDEQRGTPLRAGDEQCAHTPAGPAHLCGSAP